MCLYTSAYLHITVVLNPSFETEFICSNRGIWLQEHCTQTRGGVSFSLQWFPKRHQKKWLQDIYSCHLCTQFTIPLTEVYRCQMLPPAPLTHTRYTHCTEQVVLHMYAVHQYNYLVQIHYFIITSLHTVNPSSSYIVHNTLIISIFKVCIFFIRWL